MSINKRLPLLIILALILFHLVNNYIWCFNDWITLEGDMVDHLSSHAIVYCDLKDILDNPSDFYHNTVKLNGFLGRDSALRPTLYPPLFYISSAIFNIIIGKADLVLTRLFNIFYFAILITSVYFIGKEIVGINFGLFSAALVSFYPALFGMSRLYTLDFPLVSMTACCVLSLIKTDFFTKRSQSILFGLILGLGILIKAQIILFILWPLLYVVAKVLFRNINGNKKKYMLVNMVFAFALGAGLSSVWWAANFRDSISNFIIQATVHPENIAQYSWIGGIIRLKPLSLDWLFAYTYFLLNNISPVLFIIFIIGLVSGFRAKIKHKAIILLWFFGAYLFFTFFPIKKDRFFIPALPALAIISSWLFINLKGKVSKIIVVSGIFLFALYQFFFLSYRVVRSEVTGKNSPFYIITPMENPEICGYDLPKGNYYECVYYKPRGRDIEDMGINLLSLIRQSPNSNIDISLVIDDNVCGNVAFGVGYLLKSNDKRIRIFSNRNFKLVSRRNGKKEFDYIIAINNIYRIRDISEDQLMREISQNNLDDNMSLRNKYIMLAKWQYSFDHCQIMLFKRINSINNAL
ncbi:MAG: glycosyltransferase family 39 protein [Candidatus Omnitrophota bacterium]